MGLECPCCGFVATHDEVCDGDPLLCGCDGHVSADAETAYVVICDDREHCPPYAACHDSSWVVRHMAESDHQRQRADEAEAIANEAMRTGLAECERLRDRIDQQEHMLDAYYRQCFSDSNRLERWSNAARRLLRACDAATYADKEFCEAKEGLRKALTSPATAKLHELAPQGGPAAMASEAAHPTDADPCEE